MNQEIRELKRRLELKEQEIFLFLEEKVSEWKALKEKLNDLYEAVK